MFCEFEFMVRLPLTVLLMLLLSLPHGVCFCQILRAEAPRQEAACCESSPAAPAPTEPDDDEGDCSCMLREVSAQQPTAPVIEVSDLQICIVPDEGIAIKSLQRMLETRSSISFTPFDISIPLAVRALRF